jgi:2-polyprenyl-6-methoxyphenol hydroxylase-like FAD-dependent oxidoreductase
VSTTPQQSRVAPSEAEGTHADGHDCDVLVVGAGPTGLVLASAPGTTSRALVVHARTLELYRQLGLAAEVVERGLPFAAINLWVRGRHRARAAFGEIGRGLSPFPGMWIFPQDQHERLLIEYLHREGVEVERGTELLGFEERSGAIVARTRSADGTEARCEAAYLAGCDGAHSRVREVLGIGFAGGTYARVFYVADVAFHGPVDNHELHVALDAADLLAVFPLKGDHAARLIGTVERAAEEQRELGWDDVSRNAVERMKIAVDRVNWFSTYRVHHRVAQHFRSGRAFLVGDAAHVHSPVGGQGMNTGIGDAVNLAWKLADAVRGPGAGLLDSYEPERIAFAERLVASTDRAFTFATRDGVLARLVRLCVFPALLASVMGWTVARRLVFRMISQILVNYRPSRLSSSRAGSVRGGDRLPWVPPQDPSGDDNFTPLTSLAWQIHVYGDASSALREAAARRNVPLHVFSWDRIVARAGLARDAAYLVRPDGYVGLADRFARAETLERYLDGLH